LIECFEAFPTYHSDKNGINRHMNVEHWWNGKTEVLGEKPEHRVTFSSTNLTWTGL